MSTAFHFPYYRDFGKDFVVIIIRCQNYLIGKETAQANYRCFIFGIFVVIIRQTYSRGRASWFSQCNPNFTPSADGFQTTGLLLPILAH